VYRVPEPELSISSDKTLVGRTPPAEAFRYVFPDGPHDTEAMLVHPTTGELLLVTKEYSGLAHVYRMPQPLNAGQTARLEAIAELDLRFLGPLVSAVTDAAVAPDARRVVLRTYYYALEYELPEGESLASIWGQSPRIFTLDDG